MPTETLTEYLDRVQAERIAEHDAALVTAAKKILYGPEWTLNRGDRWLRFQGTGVIHRHALSLDEEAAVQREIGA